MSVRELIKNEIDKIPEDILPEILDFIQFLELKKEKSILAKASQNLSEKSFKKIWDNDKDTIYDEL
ncbi:MAG: toxin-antitoxin system, antitoxin component, Xre family protein [Candidatus Poribacteria bacterium]